MSDGMGERVSDAIVPGWEVVIGLEVHAELATATKLFSTARNEFGGDPNTNVDPVSLGLPGSLPVLNEKAVELAIRVGLALDCEIGRSVFARKNYFYPDMPKDFQISQYELPINGRGRLELPDGRTVGIERAHLEEDTGKSTHVGGGGRIHEADHSLVDYNRAGVPLIEIVGAPDLRGPEDARAYVAELRAILVAIGASDGKMEEGSMRVDCNVSVRREGAAEFGTRCEIKNINSLRSLGRAIEYEARRQVDLIEAGEAVQQQTRHWNEDEGRTHTLRSKEEAYDYRYFPEPDLVPVDPSDEWIAEIRATLPALPRERRHRLAEAAGVDTAAAALTVERGMDDPTPSPPSSPWRSAATSPPPRPRPSSSTWSPPAATPPPTPPPTASRPWTPANSSPSSTGSSPTTPTTGPGSSAVTTRSARRSPASSWARS